jgi:hypothetical protein
VPLAADLPISWALRLALEVCVEAHGGESPSI